MRKTLSSRRLIGMVSLLLLFGAMTACGNVENPSMETTQSAENNEQITTGPGDIILYLGDSLVIYYDTNSWNFTRIGKINDVTKEELLAAMGGGNVSVTFELEE